MVGLGLKASPLELRSLVGGFSWDQKWTYIIALAYVDDLLIVSDSKRGLSLFHKSLSAVLKVKVTGSCMRMASLSF